MTTLRNQAVIKITQFEEGRLSPGGIQGELGRSLIWQIRMKGGSGELKPDDSSQKIALVN